jgi:hypothetical protein
LKIIAGQNITKVSDKFTMAKRLLHGDALAVFETVASAMEQIENLEFDLALQELALHVFPKNALTNQKSWLRRSSDARKVPSILTRQWVARLREINLMLPEFPPDFDEAQKLRPEDVTDILEYGIPHKWKAKMVEMGFRPADHTPAEFVEFCERLESAEQMLGLTSFDKTTKTSEQKGSMPKEAPNGSEKNTGSVMSNAKTPQKRKNEHKRCQSFVESKGKDGCGYHIHSQTHTSNECKVLMAQASSMRGQAEAQFNKYKKNGGKSQKNNGNLHTIMAQVQKMNEKLEKHLKKQTPKTNKKCSRKEVDSDEESDNNFDPDAFCLDLEQESLNNSFNEDDVSDIVWEEDNPSEKHVQFKDE